VTHAEGLIALSGCLNGVITDPLLRLKEDDAFQAVGRYQEIYGKENFYLEIQDHGMDEDSRVLRGLGELSRRTGAPLVATNDCHYMQRTDSLAHDVLLCIQTGKGMSDPTRWKFANDQFYFKTREEMAALFAERPDAIRATVEIAERVDFELEQGENHLPNFDIPTDEGLETYFRRVVREGFTERTVQLQESARRGELRRGFDEYEARLEEELGIIERMRFPSYFLIVWDFIRYARELQIPVGPGRGSAAGSLVAYCLRITDIDPLQYDLLFERFLNPERVSMPDIDIDFCMRGRGRVIEYVTERYGRESVAQIITFGTMAARAAIRDVGRALELSYGDCDRVAKLIPPALDMTIEKALETVPALVEATERDPKVKNVIELAQRLEGLTRHASVHAAGVVIAPGPVTDFCPLYRTNRDEFVTQFAKDEIETIGLLKMDFLGLRTLTVIDDCVKGVERVLGETIVLESLPLDDKATYELFAAGGTTGVFQFESRGMKDFLRRLKPDRFEDLIALNALYRPGPMQMIDDYIESILSETYGVIVYQEQVMRIASTLAGFSLGEADILRKAMGKKKADVMAAMRQKFMSGTKANKIATSKATKIFTTMERFASYAFNKSHSAAYALLAYQTGYLKAHYPEHFMAAVLTSEHENTAAVVKYIAECRGMGIEVLPPDINASNLHFTVTAPLTIRFGMGAIKNVGEGAIASILESRGAKGQFQTLRDLCEDLDLRLVNKRVLESLIKSGALDSLGFDRARLSADLDRALDGAQSAQHDKIAGQENLFGGIEVAGSALDDRLPEAEPWSDRDRLTYEKESIGFYITGHPLTEFKALLAKATNADSAILAEGGPQEAIIGGIVAAVRTTKTRKGTYMAYVTLEDMHGVVEVIVFPDLYQKCMPLLDAGRLLIVSGKPEAEEQSVRLIATDVSPIEHARMRAARLIRIQIDLPCDDTALERLYSVFQRNRGSIPVQLVMRAAGQFRALLEPHATFRLNGSPKAYKEIEELLGDGTVEFEEDLA